MANTMVDKVAVTRREDGKHAARSLRAEGRVPAVVYGHGESRSVAFEVRDALAVQAMPRNHVFTLALAGAEADTVRVVALQRDPVSGRILHLDLERVVRGQRAHASVNVHIVGEEDLQRREGVLTRLLDRLEVEGETMHMPSEVTVDVSALEAGGHVLAGDIVLPAGVNLITAADAPVVQVGYAHHGADAAVASPGTEGEAAAAGEEGKA